jgi:hypothetical protein
MYFRQGGSHQRESGRGLEIG